jgi:glutaminyl-tRNA synthetase
MSEHTPASPETPADSHEKRDFIRQIVREDLASGKHQAIKTRFPPEPNGYLHIGHAKSICLNFGIAGEFSGVCNLRFDDTNPAKEDPEYVAAIQDDVRWLGFEWNELRHASDYFQAYYLAAEKLIEQGKAYVCDLSAEEVRAYRGTLTEPGRPSPWRDRSVEENLDLFRRMRAGEFPDGARTLRAKIDMASGNINLRDPALYRIKHVEHQNTGNGHQHGLGFQIGGRHRKRAQAHGQQHQNRADDLHDRTRQAEGKGHFVDRWYGHAGHKRCAEQEHQRKGKSV